MPKSKKTEKTRCPKNTARSEARALAFQVLYSLEFTQIKNTDALRSAFASAPRIKNSGEQILVSNYILEENEENPDSAPNYFVPSLDTINEQDDIIEDNDGNTVQPIGFAWELVEGVWQHLKELDNLIQSYAKNWRLERLGRIELALLRLALFEMLYRDDIPVKVSITEALDLTNQFAEEKARSFINGLLDAVHKDRLQEKQKTTI